MTHEEDEQETFRLLEKHGYAKEQFMEIGGPDLAPLSPVLEKNSLRIAKEVGTEGSCLFRSISHLIFGKEENHFEIRKKLVEKMKENPAFYLEVFENTGRSQEFSSFSSYLEEAIEETFYADEIFLRALQHTKFEIENKKFLVGLSVYTWYDSVLHFDSAFSEPASSAELERFSLKVGLLPCDHYVPLEEEREGWL